MEAIRVRTQRYISFKLGTTIKGLRNSLLAIAWYTKGNGIPNTCWLLIPSSSDNVMISLEGRNQAWVAVDTLQMQEDVQTISFDARLDKTAESGTGKQFAKLNFSLKYKLNNNKIYDVAECSIKVRLMSHKELESPVVADFVVNNHFANCLDSLPFIPITDFARKNIPADSTKGKKKRASGESGSGRKKRKIDQEEELPSSLPSSPQQDSTPNYIEIPNTTIKIESAEHIIICQNKCDSLSSLPIFESCPQDVELSFLDPEVTSWLAGIECAI